MASSSSSAAASNSNSASSPWELITIGKGASQQLKDHFEVNNHGGLTCLGCGRMYLRGDLEKASRAVSSGACGMLTSHLLSQQHKAGKAKPSQAITSWLAPQAVSNRHHQTRDRRLRQRLQQQVAVEHQEGQADR
jgi:hypothetical protein